MSSLSQASTAMILSSAATTLLLLRNNWILLHQSLNFVLSLSNHPGPRTMLFVSTFLLCTAVISAVNISSVSGVASSVLWFDMLSLVILNDSSISSNASIVFGLCSAVLSVCSFFLELFLFLFCSFHYTCFV